MQVECFACDTRIEAPDLAAIAERLSDDVTRRDTIGEVTIHPATPDTLADWQHVFDHDGFTGNPDWASCCCLEHHVPTTPEEPEHPWREARSMMPERLGSGTTFGYLAYVDGWPAGWVNASLRSDYHHYRVVDADHFRGPRGMYEARGFANAATTERHAVLRRVG